MNAEPTLPEIFAAAAIAWASVLLGIAYLYAFASDRRSRRHE